MEFSRRAQAAGASFVTVHGRTARQRREPVSLEAMAMVADALAVPVLANGDVRSREDALRTAEETGVRGDRRARSRREHPRAGAGTAATTLFLPAVGDNALWANGFLERRLVVSTKAMNGILGIGQ